MTPLLLFLFFAAQSPTPDIFFQAHRGGLLEVPENTLLAYQHAWNIPGAIPEVDVCTTADGAFICLHDDTLERTTDASTDIAKVPVSKLPLEKIRAVNAASHFPNLSPQRVPILQEVLSNMKQHQDRQVYLDLKNIDLAKLNKLLNEYGIEKQIIFVHGSPDYCAKLALQFPKARTMTWLSGSPQTIQNRFDELAKKQFAGISQLQLHLQVAQKTPQITYQLDEDFLKKAVEMTDKYHVALQVRPFEFNAASLRYLKDLGIRWYVTDEPKRFYETLKNANTSK